MNNNHLRKIYYFLTSQLNHWCFFSLFLSFSLVFCKLNEVDYRIEILSWIGCGVYLTLLHFGRIYIQKNTIYVLYSIFLLVVTFFLPSQLLMIRSMFLVYNLFHFISNIVSRQDEYIKSISLIPLPVFFVVDFISLVLLKVRDINGYERIILVSLFVLTFFYFLSDYLLKYISFIDMNKKTAERIPAKSILIAGLSQVSLLASITLIGMFIIGRMQWVFLLLNKAWGNFLRISRILLNYLLVKEPALEEQIIEEEPEILEYVDDFEIPEGNELLSKILNGLFFALAIVVILLIICYIIYSFKKFLQQKITDPLKSSENEDIREEYKLPVTKKRNSFFSRANTNQKIRKLYKKRMEADQKHLSEHGLDKNPNRVTARDYGQAFHNMPLSNIYEKARYSDALCTNDDLVLMKEACKIHE